MGKLRDQMQGDLQLRGITTKSQKAYLREVRNFARYFGKSPEELRESEVYQSKGSDRFPWSKGKKKKYNNGRCPYFKALIA